ncbi:MAG: Crp/Fnr family transcriptional regulator [Microcoleaceae cyanobacterium]
MLLHNKLLASLPAAEYKSLAPDLMEVPLILGEVLCEPKEVLKWVYFPQQAAISLVSILENGDTTEVGLVGNEGVLGYPVFLGGKSMIHRGIVQLAGSALRIEPEKLMHHFQQGGKLQQLLLLHTQALLTQVSQTAACNRHHVIDKRLARWLLTARDCVLSNEFMLTQEFIASMLGTRRAGITEALGRLQQAGMIQTQRGQITILNASALESFACECYSTVCSERNRLLSPSPD